MQRHPFLSGEEQRLRNYSPAGQTSRSIVAKNQTPPCRTSPSPTSMQPDLRMRCNRCRYAMACSDAGTLTGPPGLPPDATQVSWFIHSSPCHSTLRTQQLHSCCGCVIHRHPVQLVVLPLRTELPRLFSFPFSRFCAASRSCPPCWSVSGTLDSSKSLLTQHRAVPISHVI